MFRFSLQQFLLLILLVGLFAGYCTSVLRRPFDIPIDRVAVSPDENLVAVGGDYGRAIFDTRTGNATRIHSDQGWNSYFVFGREASLAFPRERTIVYSSRPSFQESEKLNFYSLDERAIEQTIALEPARTASITKLEFGWSAVTYSDTRLSSVYDLATGRRLYVRFPAVEPEPGVYSCRTSGDGKTVFQVFDSGNQRSVRGFNITDRTLTGETALQPGEDIYPNGDGSKLLVVGNSGMRMLNGSDFSPFREDVAILKRQSGLQWWIKLTRDFRMFVAYHRPTRTFFKIDANTGETVSTFKLPRFPAAMNSDPRSWALSGSGKKLYLPCETTDQGVFSVVLEDGNSFRRTGTHSRYLLPILFGFLFAGWTFLWAWFGPAKKSTTPESLPGKVDPFGDEPETSAAHAVGSQVDAVLPGSDFAEVHWIRENERSLKTVHALLSCGGIWAIFWTAFKPFYPNIFNAFPFSVPDDVVLLALFWSFIGILTGVLCAASGFSKSKHFLRVIASLQILSLVNCDLINVVLGIVVTSFLNMPKLRRYLDHVTVPREPSGRDSS